MFIADELEKFLVCEICFEKLNNTAHCPTTLFPCGHTFCLACIRSITVKKCPACAADFDITATNWSLLNLIPKPKLADNFEIVRDLITHSNDLLKKFETLNEEKNHEYLNTLDTIRSEINAKAEELIGKIKQNQASLCESLSVHETKWKKDYDEYLKFRDKLDATFVDAEEQLKLEEVKTNKSRLERIKASAETSLNELKTFKLKLVGNGQEEDEEILFFKKSNLFNMNVNEVFSQENLFGQLIFNQKETTTFEQYNLITDKRNDRDLNEIKSNKSNEPAILKVDSLNRGDLQALTIEEADEFKLINKQYIDLSNQALDDSLPRNCTLKRSSKSEFYGFDLKTFKENGTHWAKSILPKSPAAKAGLKDGDLILEVNGESVSGVERETVISKMGKNPKQCDLLVVTNFKSYLDSKNNLQVNSVSISDRRQRSSTLNANLAKSNSQFDPLPISRICCLVAVDGSKSFGYSLTPNTANGPHRVHQVTRDSPAFNAGLKVDDLLLKLNGVELAGKSYTKVIEMLKSAAQTGKYQLEVIEGKVNSGGTNGAGLRNRSMSFSSLNTKEFQSSSNESLNKYSKNGKISKIEANDVDLRLQSNKSTPNVTEKVKLTKQPGLFGLIKKKKEKSTK